ncbi:Cj0069 family protein [Vibrio mediterranei]|uniref:Cj0069 family protein n=1 Tax=Vibrio mediterranei TaxID=689 RepID=UPI0022853A5E|nr:Cj0069 family protein [Vibrio mediterranei]MCY9855284.1 Cj0069 family protein [Vibrio mediterranei]
MKDIVVILEAIEDENKDETGFRKDTMPIIKALNSIGVECKAIHFSSQNKDRISSFIKANACAYISRVNPGKLASGEDFYFSFLANLIQSGVIGMEPPDTLLALGSKSSLHKLVGTEIVPDDLRVYSNSRELESKFVINDISRDRVLKQNRGSSGNGVWRVSRSTISNSKVRVTSAQNNNSMEISLGTFLKKIISFESGSVIDMPFLPGIKNGEYRVLLVGEKPCYVIHKSSVQGQHNFSTTLHSGSCYNYSDISNYPNLIQLVNRSIGTILEVLNDSRPAPLLWSLDFIRSEKNGTYVLSEINCNCLGFTSMLDTGLPDLIAQEIVKRIF